MEECARIGRSRSEASNKEFHGMSEVGAFMPGNESMIKTKGDTGHRKSAQERAEDRKKKKKKGRR